MENILNTDFYQPLFNLMREHNLTLLEGEMDEIIECVSKMLELDKNKTFCDHDKVLVDTDKFGNTHYCSKCGQWNF